MQEDDFLRELNKYRVIRSRDSVISFVNTHSISPQAITNNKSSKKVEDVEILSMNDSSNSSNTVLLPKLPKEFWKGLDEFLGEHFEQNDAQRISAAFSDLHYNTLRHLNFEDINELGQMFDRENKQ